MAGKKDAKEVVDLALIPVGAVVEAGDTGDRRGLIGVGLDTDAGVVADGQEVVHYFEALVAGGEVACSDGAHLCEFSRGVVCIGGSG